MIQIDKRAGSENLIAPLRQLGCEVEATMLPFGDAAFIGWGANGDPVSVGIAVKSIEDVVACLPSGRFSGHQLPGLIQSYDHIWLLVVAEWRARARDGVLEYRKEGRGGGYYWAELCGGQRIWFWRDVQSYLTTCEIMGGIRVHSVPDYRSAAQWIKCLASWFAKEEHLIQKIVYAGKEMYSDQALLVKPTLARRIAKELPFIGIKRSAEVARVFHTLEQMVEAAPKDWMRVEGIGKGIASKI